MQQQGESDIQNVPSATFLFLSSLLIIEYILLSVHPALKCCNLSSKCKLELKVCLILQQIGRKGGHCLRESDSHRQNPLFCLHSWMSSRFNWSQSLNLKIWPNLVCLILQQIGKGRKGWQPHQNLPIRTCLPSPSFQNTCSVSNTVTPPFKILAM